MKRILCCLISMVILAAFLPVGSMALSKDSTELVVVAFGDSITAADNWQKHLESQFGIDIINAGVGGDSTKSAKSRFKTDVLNKFPDVVFISFGTNDSAIDMAKSVTVAEYKENLTYYIEECKKVCAKVIINIPPPVVDELYLTRHQSAPFEPYGGPNGLVAIYAEAAREVAREQDVYYTDLNQVFSSTDDYTKYFPDGVHPSDTGYKMYADAVAPIYEKLFLGDVDFDGSVDVLDYILIKRACLKTVTLDSEESKRADINKDGIVDAQDYIFVKRICLGNYKIV